MNVARPLSAMVSYQSTDGDAAELLHEELALRGFVVIHDQCSFVSGARIGTEMDLGVQSCDVFVSLLTPESLYLDAEPGSPRPALEEFLAAMQRRRRPATVGTRDPIVVLPIPKRLGSRAEAAKKVLRRTGERIGSLWVTSADFDSPDLSQSEASAIAEEALVATLSPALRTVPNHFDICFVTRGHGQPARFLTIDATPLVGGSRKAGGRKDWKRILRGLGDVERALASTSTREINLVAKAHISGAFAIGRVFNQLGGWRLSVKGRYGDVQPSPMQAGDRLYVTVDPQGPGRDLSCEISLVGQPVFEMARDAIRSIPLDISGRLQISPRRPGDIDSETASLMAAEAACTIRARITATRPSQTHIFCASPVEIAVLIGHRLTALGTDLCLYEPEGDTYRLALVIPAHVS